METIKPVAKYDIFTVLGGLNAWHDVNDSRHCRVQTGVVEVGEHGQADRVSLSAAVASRSHDRDILQNTVTRVQP